MIKGTVSEQTHFKSISPDHISVSGNTMLNIPPMHGCYATAKDVFFLRAPCVSPLHSPITYIFDKEDITYVSGGGGGAVFAFLHRAGDRLFAFYTRKRILHSSCLFNWIRPLEGVALQKMRCGPPFPAL